MWTSTTEAPTSYEQALAQLQNLVERLESQDCPLSDLAVLHQQAKALLDYCQKQLREVETNLEDEKTG